MMATPSQKALGRVPCTTRFSSMSFDRPKMAQATTRLHLCRVHVTACELTGSTLDAAASGRTMG